MLKYGNKEFRNLQEQVLENMKDIANLQEGTAVLSEFGIKVVGEVETIADLPTVLEYKSEHEDWAYGDAYAVGTASPYTLYILTRENDTHDKDYWFDIGVFPAPGPQGEQGPKGETGPQGQTGATGEPGASAGFGTITATAETLSSGSPATASVAVSGPDTAKEFAFTFGIPQNTPAGFTHYITITPSGTTSGTLSQSEYNTLYDNYDSIIRLRVGTNTISYYFLKKWSVTDDYMRYICLWSVNNTDTRYYLITIDRSNRNWTLASGEPFKVSQYNINSGSATNGQVLTADGSGGASWLDAGGSGLEVVTLTQSVSTLSDDDYNKLNGDNAIIKFVSSADGWTKYFKKYKDDGTYIYYYQVSQEDGSGTFFGGFRIVKSTKYCASLNSYLKVSTSNINSGSTIADKYLKTNGSGGAVWGDAPSQVQSDWNESSQSSPAYIKNKPTLATVATSGSYNDLTNKPTIPSVSGSYSGDYWTSINLNGTSKSLVAAGALHYQGQVGSSADITWTNLISSSKSVKAGDFWYVKTARVFGTPTASTGNLLIATTDGTGTSTTWKVLPTTDKTGTVTSVRVQATAPVQSSTSTAQSTSLNTTISLASEYGDTQNPYGSKTANYVLAAPNGSAGTPSFRALVKADLPTLTASDVGALPDSTVIPDAVSGTNDGTNWTSLTIGSDTYNIPAGGGTATDVQINGTSIVSSDVANIITEGVYDATTNKIATMADLPSTSNFVTLDGTQSITGAKTIDNSNGLQFARKSDHTAIGKIYVNGSTFEIRGGGTYINFPVPNGSTSTNYLKVNNRIVPATHDTYDLGASGNAWKDIYFRGSLKDNTNTLSLADIAAKSTVSGTNDGTNWTSLTVDGVTKSIPAGGGSQKYLHKLILRLHSSTANDNAEIPIDYYSNSDTSMSEYSSDGTILTNLNEVLTYYNAIGSTNPTSLTTLPGIYFNDSTKGHYLYYRTGGWGFYRIDLTYTTVQQNPNQLTADQYTSTTAAYALDDVKIIAL